MFARQSLRKAAPKDTDPAVRRGLAGLEKSLTQFRRTKAGELWKHGAAASRRLIPQYWTRSSTSGLNSQWCSGSCPQIAEIYENVYIFFIGLDN